MAYGVLGERDQRLCHSQSTCAWLCFLYLLVIPETGLTREQTLLLISADESTDKHAEESLAGDETHSPATEDASSMSDTKNDVRAKPCYQCIGMLMSCILLPQNTKLATWMVLNATAQSKALDMPIVAGSMRTLRAYVLEKFELFIVHKLSQAAFGELLRSNAKDLGPGHIAPTSMSQFKQLVGWLSEEVKFYLACCVPCAATATHCPECGEPLWSGRHPRPAHIFFTRSVKSWLQRLLEVPKLVQAITEYRKRAPSAEGYITDIFDGKVTKDLIANGVLSLSSCMRCCSLSLSNICLGWLSLQRDFCFLANWDGFRPFKDLSAKSVDLANLVLLALPPALRTQPELIFTWFGLSARVSNLNPFLELALEDFFDSVGDFDDDDSTTCTSGSLRC